MKRLSFIFTLISIMFASPVFADDVTDQIDEALKAYKKNDYSMATTALDSASALIRQKKGDALAKLLPEPLKGWKAEEAESSSAGAAMFGGGTNVKRVYKKGKESVTITVTTDSPMLQAMSMMFANPQFSGPNARLVVIDGRKVINDKKKNSLQTMVAGKILVNVKGKRKTHPEDVKKYFKAINFKEIEKLNK
ncbi:hypothetical protein MNBD_NITROSPINAE04-2602 [hydrothermal vent metagenome]|uniref:Uncharacterized protein n=1 Tax=hydrothermal vent metagenome TaxID=652676 RepID=A0A3B1BVE1_9ZZZZ